MKQSEVAESQLAVPPSRIIRRRLLPRRAKNEQQGAGVSSGIAGAGIERPVEGSHQAGNPGIDDGIGQAVLPAQDVVHVLLLITRGQRTKPGEVANGLPHPVQCMMMTAPKQFRVQHQGLIPSLQS